MSTNQPLTETERIALVQADRERRVIQIILAVILIGGAVGYLFYYAIIEADADFKLSLANTMLTLVTMGTGAGLAIFGLGRTVGK